MKLGIHILDYRWTGGPGSYGPILARLARRAEEEGLHSLWCMDHLTQVPQLGPPEEPMLESYATLAWVAGRTTTLQLGSLVSGVPHRHPGVLVKMVTTLDVLSGGRAWLGIGAAWNSDEARRLGVPFAELTTRYEQLEEVLQIARRMFDGDVSPFHGRHYRLECPLNEPRNEPPPPILVGGLGERRTLRLVARYADACNLFDTPGPDGLLHKLDVLRRHCDDVGRRYDEIVKTTFGLLGQTDLRSAVRRFTVVADSGVDLAIVDLPFPFDDDHFTFLGRLADEVAPLGRPAPPALNRAQGGDLSGADERQHES